jgi:UDP-galactopyranose mutase
MKVLIVGAGLSGCTIARILAEKNISVDIIEKRNHIAGNCYDERNEQGILVSRYGAHLFHTNSERVWNFIQSFANWIPWYHKVVGVIGDTMFPIPVNRTTVNTLLNKNLQTDDEMKLWLQENTIACDNPKNSKDIALKRVGSKLYDLIFHNYTYKQWNKYPYELEPSVLERIPVRITNEDGYFSDKYQALPEKGYTEFVRSMIQHPLITVSLQTEYNHSMRSMYDAVFYTGPIDKYYEEYNLPKLEYRSIRFETEQLNIDQFQSNSVVNYPSAKESFTRIVEYKHFLNQHVPNKTTIVREYTTEDGEPYYPVPTQRNRELYKQYKSLADNDCNKGVYFVGRLANYKYYNMDEAINAALEECDLFLSTVKYQSYSLSSPAQQC